MLSIARVVHLRNRRIHYYDEWFAQRRLDQRKQTMVLMHEATILLHTNLNSMKKLR
jgi:hypothetical protein